MPALAGVLAVAAVLTAGCGGTGGEAAVFLNAPGEYTYTVHVAEPTDFILYFTNTSGQAVRLTSVAIDAPPAQLRLVSVSAYDERRTGSGPATALGILSEECRGQYVPSPITSVRVPARSDSPWYGVVTVTFSKAAQYKITRFRVSYTTPDGAGWEYLSDPIQITVINPPRPLFHPAMRL